MKQRVALLHFAYPPHIGGVEILLQEHAILLSEFGYEVTVLTGSGKSTYPAVTVQEHEAFQSLYTSLPELQDKLLKKGIIDDEFHQVSRQTEELLETVLRDQDFVIVHNMLTIPRNLPFIDAFHRYANRHTDKHIIIWVHDHYYILENKQRDIPSIASSPLETKLLTTPISHATYVTISDTFKKLLAPVMGMPEEKLQVIPDGVNTRRFLEIDESVWHMIQEKQLLSSFPLILLPVNILPRKNLLYTIDAIAKLREYYPLLKVLITGSSSRHRDTEEYFQQVSDRIAKHQLTESFTFLSDHYQRALTDTELHDLYSIADAVLYFSSSENFGIPILEAGLSRTPLFISNLTVFHELGADCLKYVDTDMTAPEETAQMIQQYFEKNPLTRLSHRVRTKYDLETILKTKLLPLLGK